MSCKINKGPHTFLHTLAKQDMMIGPNKMFYVVSWHTCIACGERRAITQWGELLKKIDGEWKVVE